jgi:hypothetical protein
VIIGFFEVLGSYCEKLRVWRNNNTVKPAWEKQQERKTDVSCKKGLKNPERLRLKNVSEKAKG